MAKVVGFEIQINGTKALVNNITDVRLAISQVKKALKETADDKQAAKLEGQLVQLQGTLKNLTKEQKVLQDQFAASQYGIGSVQDLRASLKRLQLDYERLSKAEREAAEGQELLKSINTYKKAIKDAGKETDDFSEDSVKGLRKNLKGLEEQFNSLSATERKSAQGQQLAKSIRGLREEIKQTQRQVGKQSLGDIIGKGLKEQIPILNNIQGSLANVGNAASGIGKLASVGFGAFAIASEVANVVGEFKQFVDELIEVRRQIAVTFNATGAELDEITKQVQAGVQTFGTDFQETIEAANAVTQTFGVSGAKSVELLNSALLGVRDRGQFLGDITTELETLAGLGVDEESAIALIANAGNLDFNVDLITKPLGTLREASDATRKALVDAFGAATAQQIFDEFEKAPLQAIQTVSTEFAKLDDKSTESAAVLRNVFRARAGGEDIATIKSLQNISTSLDGLADAAGSAATREAELLEANEALSEAQNNIAKRFEETSNSLRVIGTQALTVVINAFNSLLEIFQPLFDAFQRLVGALSDTESESNFLAEAGRVLAFVLQTLVDINVLVIDAITFVIQGLSDFAEEVPIVQVIIDGLVGTFGFLASAIERIPAIFAGVAAAARQVGTNIANFFKGIALEVAKFQLEAEELIGFDRSEEIADIEAQLERIEKSSKSAIDAFADAYNAVIEENAKAQREAAEKAEAEEQARQEEELKRLQAQQEKANDTRGRARRARTKERDKEAEQLRKQREKAAADSVKLERERIALIAELSRQLVDAQIKNIEEGEEREIRAEQEAFARRQQQIAAQLAQQEKAVEEQRGKIAEAFGEGSKQLIQFTEQANIDLESIRQRQQALLEEETVAFEQRLQDIREKFRDERLQDKREELNELKAVIDTRSERAILELEESLARELLTEEEFNDQVAELKRDQLEDELKFLEDREEILKKSADMGVEVAESEIEQILTERQRLNTELAKLEEEQTKKTEEEAKKRTDAQFESLQQTLGFVNEAFGLIGEFATASTDQEEARLEKRAESQALRIEKLQEDLEGTSGLEKKFIEQQIEREQEAAEEIADAQIRNQKRAAAEKKAIDIAQAIINGALAVTNILATVPDPTLIGAFKAVQIAFATATTAAQVATIAAQPLAEGGVVQPVQLSDGKITGVQNIPRMGNGDNMLATVKQGEVILNARQQARAGGPSFFRSIGVPGFQGGGVVGAVSAPRVVSEIEESIELKKSFDQFAASNLRAIAAINNRLDRMKVVLNVEDLDDFNADRKNIRKSASLE